MFMINQQLMQVHMGKSCPFLVYRYDMVPLTNGYYCAVGACIGSNCYGTSAEVKQDEVLCSTVNSSCEIFIIIFKVQFHS